MIGITSLRYALVLSLSLILLGGAVFPALIQNAYAANTIVTTITSSTASSGSTTSSTTLSYTVTFAESMENFIADDITVSGTANNGSPTASNFAGSGTTYTFDVVVVSNGGTVSVVIASGVATDAGGNSNTVSNTYTITVSSRGSGCSGDCTPPTLGLDKNGRRLVQEGFSYNGNSIDVELFYTPYPLITADVGKQNKAEFKVYENQGIDAIKHFSLAFGLGKDQAISQSKAMIEWDKDHQGIETITVTDPENALQDIQIETSATHCDKDKNSECLKIVIYHTFREPLEFNIVGTDVWDVKRNAWQNYYNHGIEVIGESLNPPEIYTGAHKGHLYHLTETGKFTAVDEFGESWTSHNGYWSKDYVKPKPIIDKPTLVMTRTHSEFGKYIQFEKDVAKEKLLELYPGYFVTFEELDQIFTYSYPERTKKLSDSEILEKMLSEEIRAKQIKLE